MSKNRNVYKARSVSLVRVFDSLPEMIESLYLERELVWQLVLRDLKGRYKQSLFGFGWVILSPLVAMGTFLALNVSGVLSVGEMSVPYPVFGLIGISFWQVFSGGIIGATKSVVAAGSFVGKINFSREALVVSQFGRVMADLVLRIGLLAVVMWLYGLDVIGWVLVMPILAVPVALLALGIGFGAALVNIVYRDVEGLLGILLSFGLFLMPVMYVAPEKGLLFEVNKFNPLYFLIEVPRDLIVAGRSDELLAYGSSVAVSVGVFVVGWFLFFVTQRKLTERL